MSEVIFGAAVGVELCLSWRKASGNEIPEGALDAGGECFVIRAEHKGEWVPGKLVRGESCAYISFDGRELPVNYSYQVLVCSGTGQFGTGHTWDVWDDDLPKRALVAGSDNGDPLFVARGKYNGKMVTGKASLSYAHRRAYIPWNGDEIPLDSFDVLVFTCSPE